MQGQNNVAIVTGASRGIGLAIATELAGMGYSLGLVARSDSDIEIASLEIQKKHPKIKIINDAFDVTDGISIDKFVQRVISELGDVKVLVNNAGEYLQGTSSTPTEELEQLMDVNFIAATRFVKAVLPSMKNFESGYIFNIASLCGVETFADVGSYCASKFALVGYSTSLTQELSSLGIKVTVICPSWVNTQQAIGAPIKPDEMIQPEDLAVTIKYLLGLGPTASIRKLVIHCK